MQDVDVVWNESPHEFFNNDAISGEFDAYFEDGFGGPWDCAAGAILVTEAGGQVSDIDGSAFDVMNRRCVCVDV